MVILGISRDPVEANRAFAEKFGFPFRLLSDPDGRASLAYGAIDAVDERHPRRVSYLVGADGRILQVYDPVDPKRHAGEVLADL